MFSPKRTRFTAAMNSSTSTRRARNSGMEAGQNERHALTPQSASRLNRGGFSAANENRCVVENEEQAGIMYEVKSVAFNMSY